MLEPICLLELPSIVFILDGAFLTFVAVNDSAYFYFSYEDELIAAAAWINFFGALVNIAS